MDHQQSFQVIKALGLQPYIYSVLQVCMYIPLMHYHPVLLFYYFTRCKSGTMLFHKISLEEWMGGRMLQNFH